MSKRRYPFKYASEIAIGQAIIADGPSPLASIKDGRWYRAADTKMDDRLGYVRIDGDETWYRPYLFSAKDRL